MIRVIKYKEGDDTNIFDDFSACWDYLEKHPNSKVSVLVKREAGGK